MPSQTRDGGTRASLRLRDPPRQVRSTLRPLLSPILTYFSRINSVIFDTVVLNSPGGAQRFKVKSNAERLETPFLERLERCGYHGDDDPGAESEDYPWA